MKHLDLSTYLLIFNLSLFIYFNKNKTLFIDYRNYYTHFK